MRLGLIGALGDEPEERLRAAAERLLGEEHVDFAIYLGMDGAAERVTETWRKELTGGDERPFLDRAVDAAVSGSPDEIEALLRGDARLERLARIRTIPAPPARGVEMVGDRIVLVVADKSILDEEDIANASVIVYGRARTHLLKRFGPRYFFTPGPLLDGGLGLLVLEDEGRLVLSAMDIEGEVRIREVLHTRKTKLTVAE